MRYRDRDDGERIIYVERDDAGEGGLRWFVVGAALGAGLALLFAPQSGAKTRRDLGRRIGNLRDQAGEGLEALADGIEQGAERIRERVERWTGDGDSVAADVVGELAEELEEDVAPEEDSSALTAREELERRLSEARARRRRPEPSEEEPVA
jgi:gas vesicle protein